MRNPELDAPSLQCMEGHLQTSMEVWVDNNNKKYLVIDDDVTKETKGIDVFCKIRPVVERVRQGCLALMRPKSVSIDEQIIPFSGSCPCQHYIPKNPNPVGMNKFVMASSDGLMLDFDIHQGTKSLEQQVQSDKTLGLGALVVARLAHNLTEGSQILCDRFLTRVHYEEQDPRCCQKAA